MREGKTPQPELLTLREVAALLKMRPNTLYAKKGLRHELPVTRIGRLVRVNADDLREWLRAQREQPAA